MGKFGALLKKVSTAIKDEINVVIEEKKEEREIYKKVSRTEKLKQIREKAKKDVREKNKPKKDLWGEL